MTFRIVDKVVLGPVTAELTGAVYARTRKALADEDSYTPGMSNAERQASFAALDAATEVMEAARVRWLKTYERVREISRAEASQVCNRLMSLVAYRALRHHEAEKEQHGPDESC